MMERQQSKEERFLLTGKFRGALGGTLSERKGDADIADSKAVLDDEQC